MLNFGFKSFIGSPSKSNRFQNNSNICKPPTTESQIRFCFSLFGITGRGGQGAQFGQRGPQAGRGGPHASGYHSNRGRGKSQLKDPRGTGHIGSQQNINNNVKGSNSKVLVYEFWSTMTIQPFCQDFLTVYGDRKAKQLKTVA